VARREAFKAAVAVVVPAAVVLVAVVLVAVVLVVHRAVPVVGQAMRTARVPSVRAVLSESKPASPRRGPRAAERASA
jgi:hypothetical protein